MLLQAPEGHFECQVFCAKTIVIVKDCCLVAGGLCRSSASIHPSELRSCREPLTRPRPAMLRQSPPATITSLDNAPQSKLRSSAQGLLGLLCDSDAQKMQINRDFTLGTKKPLSGMLTADWVVEVDGVEPTTLCLQSRCSSQLSYTPVFFVILRIAALLLESSLGHYREVTPSFGSHAPCASSK